MAMTLSHRGLLGVLLIGVVLLGLASLAIGSTAVPVLGGLWQWLQGQGTLAAIVVGEVRLPRTLLALCAGACLGLAGAALQGLLRNPLADPSLTGASQGAALGAAAVFYFGLFPLLGIYASAVGGLLGALAALVLVLWLAGPGNPARVILAGLAVSTVAGAALAAVLTLAPNPYALQELVFWLMGSVAERGLEQLWVLLPALLLGGALVWHQRHLLHALSLGESVAESLGFAVGRGSRWLVLGCGLLVGGSVAVAGGIGFVGLMVPHLLRPLLAHRADRLLLPCALAGAGLVLVADMLVRLMPPGRQLQLGVLTALVGAPLFVRLVVKERRQ
ncbi:iron ABC transporter permease [Stenotrophomonas sp. W1S232]|uniref:Iron ABC transporter permease n=2 Tax=Stenotrophomonas koreensis TaxID=266128 RepID=A0A7W3UZS8_9GAMM|nr:iron ABC transporter permease [Stenotrophomonas koreensis]